MPFDPFMTSTTASEWCPRTIVLDRLSSNQHNPHNPPTEGTQMPNPRPGSVLDCRNCDADIHTDTDVYFVRPCGCCYLCNSCADECAENDPEEFDDLRAVVPSGDPFGFVTASQERLRSQGVIHAYSYKPRRYNSKGNYPTEVLMGVELEVGGSKYEIAGRAAEIDPDEETLYCKDDCSIYGAEIVSHPFTLKWVKEWGGYDQLLEKLRGDGCYSDREDCICSSYGCDHEFGLHIHVSRNAFRQARKRRSGPEPIADNETYEQRIGREMRAIRRAQREQEAINHQMIWLMFLERNSDQLAGDDKLARRVSHHYGAFKKSNLDELQRKSQNFPFYENRYTAINCNNDRTYELRFFKSTVNTEEFYAALEFADASVEFTRNIDAGAVLRGRALEWSNFVGWVNEQKTDTETGVVMKYANLIAQINSLGLN